MIRSGGFAKAIRGRRTKTQETVTDAFLSPDNLTPRETSSQDPSEVGTDGSELSCPGSSEVAEGRDLKTLKL